VVLPNARTRLGAISSGLVKLMDLDIVSPGFNREGVQDFGLISFLRLVSFLRLASFAYAFILSLRLLIHFVL
jgi:hypothetical protein